SVPRLSRRRTGASLPGKPRAARPGRPATPVRGKAMTQIEHSKPGARISFGPQGGEQILVMNDLTDCGVIVTSAPNVGIQLPNATIWESAPVDRKVVLLGTVTTTRITVAANGRCTVQACTARWV